MDYYACQIGELRQETRRRGYTPLGTGDELSEGLKRDDEQRGADATTVKTEEPGQFIPQGLNQSRTAEFGQSAPAGLLANEKVVYWTMNTFFATLQLFFESGLSCTIDGARFPDATVGLDPTLRFRLTDCTHEEDGRITRTVIPEKFASSGTGLVIREACITQRISIAVKPGEPEEGAYTSRRRTLAKISRELHTVVGLRMEGMKKMAYVWAKARRPTASGDRAWGDVRIAGFRRDIAAPSLGYPERALRPGGQAIVVIKESMINDSPKDDTMISRDVDRGQ